MTSIRKAATDDIRSRPGLFPNPEQQLVLRAALGEKDEALAAYAQWAAGVDLTAEFDREVFRLLPLLYERLRVLGHRDALTGRLKGVYRLAWAKSHRLFEDTRPILERFVSAGLPVMALKGAPLGLLYYGNVALRPMSDVDLVVPAARVDVAVGILQDLGYRPWKQVDTDLKRFRHAVGFYAPGPREFDLHWHVLFDFCDDGPDQEFWQTAQAFRFLDQDILTPDSTRMLVHTIIHGLRWNVEPPIRWIPDSIMILRQSATDIDWEWVIDFGVRRRASFRIYLGLSHLAEHYAAPIPAHVLERLGRTRLSLIERIECRSALRPIHYESLFGPVWEALADFPVARESGSKLRVAGAFLHFLRFHWSLDGRRNIPGWLGRRIVRRASRGARALMGRPDQR